MNFLIFRDFCRIFLNFYGFILNEVKFKIVKMIYIYVLMWQVMCLLKSRCDVCAHHVSQCVSVISRHN